MGFEDREVDIEDVLEDGAVVEESRWKLEAAELALGARAMLLLPARMTREKQTARSLQQRRDPPLLIRSQQRLQR